MPDLEEKVYALDTRVSEVEKDISSALLTQQFHTKKVENMEKVVVDHMMKEEHDRQIMEEKIDGLIRYKWILFGAMVMLWLTSGDNQILSLLKIVG